jgi:hypothetical protein
MAVSLRLTSWTVIESPSKVHKWKDRNNSYEILALEWFKALQGGKKPLGGFTSAHFGFPISFPTPKG